MLQVYVWASPVWAVFRSNRKQQICKEVRSWTENITTTFLQFVSSRRAKYLRNDEERTLIEGVLMEKVEQEYRKSINVSFSWKRLFMELSLIGECFSFPCMYWNWSNENLYSRFHCVYRPSPYCRDGDVFQSFLHVCEKGTYLKMWWQYHNVVFWKWDGH